MKNYFLKIALLLFSFAFLVTFSSCFKHKGFKKHETGFYYKFHEKNKNGTPIQIGDFVEVIHTLYAQDSTLIPSQVIQLLVREPLFEGDLYEALSIMNEGDSATFIMNVDTFFLYFFGVTDYNLSQKNRDIFLDFRVKKVIPAEEFEKEQAIKEEEMRIEMEKLSLVEDSLLQDYLKSHNIKVKPTETGLYFISKVPGKGRNAKFNDLVTVHYTGRLLDGTQFDSSIGKDPLQLPLGQGRVIPGWEEGLSLMKEGGKAQLIIPSSLGYGSYGAGGVIPPFATLIFDVELIKVEDMPEVPFDEENM